MNAQQLKNSILQMAVQGKLVPQDPNDEPASVLLERIYAEKEELIKQGKIKKEKNPSRIFRGTDNLPYEKIGKNEPVCIAAEVPFEIPSSWEWARLSTICTKLVDGDHNPPKGESTKTSFIMASSTNINNDALVDLEKVRYLSEEVFKKEHERTQSTAGDIFFTSVGSLGRSCVFQGGLDICFQRSVSVITTLLYNYYLKFYFDSGYIQKKIVAEATGTAQKGFYLNQMAKILVPIPPFQEQKKIVEQIQNVIPFINCYDTTTNELLHLNEGFPDALKKSILQWAVQGKLVPQDPNDEPASALLDRIRAEKELLIKAGKIKRDRRESTIFRRDNSHYEKRGSEEVCIDNELPFDIPDSWELVRLKDIGIYRKGPFGSALTKGMFVKKSSDTVKVYEQKNVIKKDHTLGDYYITRKYYDEKMRVFSIKPGDIIVSCAGTIGETYILPDNIEEGIINQALMRMEIFAPINIDYFLLYFDYVLKESAKANSKGSAIKNIPPFDIFKKLLLPLPPLEEQRRIVTQVKVIEALSGSLT